MSEELVGKKFRVKTKLLWHSTQIYCLAFDRNGKYIFTGGDDGVLKIYSISKDRLIKSLSDQNSDEFTSKVEDVCRSLKLDDNQEVNIESHLEKFAICDIAVNHENTLVSAGKHNGSILVWNLQTFDLIIKFEDQLLPIRSVLFSSAIFEDNRKFLISTSEDGFIFIYGYNPKTLEFNPKTLHRRSKYDGDRAVDICVDMTPGGLLIGLIHTFGVKNEGLRPKSKKEPLIKLNSQSAIRIFSLNEEIGLKEEWKTTYHKSHEECVYSFRFSHNAFRFASACDKDTNAYIWTFDKANKKWDSIIVGINAKGETQKLLRGKSKQSIESVFVDEIVFSCDDKYMITVLTDISIKVWNSESGDLVQHFKGQHSEKISVVESHPYFGHIFISAGYDSQIYIYDILKGIVLQKFECDIKSENIDKNSLADELGLMYLVKPLLLQCSFSPDGQSIGVTDNHGNLTVFSLESQKESDSLDKLEEVLCRMYSESDDENLAEIGLTATDHNLKLIKAMFEYETDLLKGIEKPSPLKQSQNTESKKLMASSSKKLSFEAESTSKQKQSNSNVVEDKDKDIKSNKKIKTPKKDTLVKTTPKPLISNETTPKPSPKKVISDKKETDSSPQINRLKGSKGLFTDILDQIFENPNSRPFQINDEIQYPTFRKEISDADLCLTSIREDILLNKRYSLTKFNKDMNKVIENAKYFYKRNDEEVYDMALNLEKFYRNKMEIQFGSIFKPPKKMSDEEISDNSSNESSDSKLIPKVMKKGKNTETDKNSTQVITKESPKLNGKQTPKNKNNNKEKESETKKSKTNSNRKRSTIRDKSESDSESTPGKRTKTDTNLESKSTDNDIETRSQKKQNLNNEIKEDSHKDVGGDKPDEVIKDIAVDDIKEVKDNEISEEPHKDQHKDVDIEILSESEETDDKQNSNKESNEIEELEKEDKNKEDKFEKELKDKEEDKDKEDKPEKEVKDKEKDKLEIKLKDKEEDKPEKELIDKEEDKDKEKEVKDKEEDKLEKEVKDKEEDKDKEKDKLEKEDKDKPKNTIEDSISKPKTVVNGDPVKDIAISDTNSSDNQNEMQLKNCLFCLFCDKIFWSISEAKSHYIQHLCPLKCSKCDQLFDFYNSYLSHDCGHPTIPNNIEWCRQYSDSINWIEKFIEFQRTEDIEKFEKISSNQKKCIVCEKLEKFRPKFSYQVKESKPIDSLTHLEKHLKYVPQFQCLICLLNNDKYCYCKNSDEADKHLKKEHSEYSVTDSSLKYFDGSIPKLDEIILQFYS